MAKRGRKSKQIDIEEKIEEQTTAATNGHNKPELTDDEKRALMLQHKRHYETALAAATRA